MGASKSRLGIIDLSLPPNVMGLIRSPAQKHAGGEMKCTRRRVDKPCWAKPRWHARYMYGDSIPGCAPKPTPYEVRRAWVRGERLGGSWVFTGGGSFARRAGVIWVRSRGPWGADRAIVGAPLRCRS
jgi:hypothetical protein